MADVQDDRAVAIGKLYDEETKQVILGTSLELVDPNEHTLLDALKDYVKVKTDYLQSRLANALEKNRNVVVAGVLKEDFGDWCRWNNYKPEKQLFDAQSIFRRKKKIKLYAKNDVQKFFNTERPAACWIKDSHGSKMLVIVVVPGRDFVTHFSELVLARMRFDCEMHGRSPDDATQLLKVWIYPKLCDQIMDRMELERFLGDRVRNSVVVLGYTERFCSYVQQVPEAGWSTKQVGSDTLLDPKPPDFFACKVLERQNVRVVFLSMRYTFWGDISYFLVKKLLELGARCVLYGAKLGTLRHPKDADLTLYFPTEFVKVDAHGASVVLEGVKNCLASIRAAGPRVKRGGHVSVPTIFYETKRRLNTLQSNQNYSSIDNEIGCMAKAVKEALDKGNKVQFGVVHYPTDFLNVWQKVPETLKNMLKTNSSEVDGCKDDQATIIWEFLESWKPTQDNLTEDQSQSPKGSHGPATVYFLDTYQETAETSFLASRKASITPFRIIPANLRIDRLAGDPKWEEWRSKIDQLFTPCDDQLPSSFHFAGLAPLSLWILLGMHCQKTLNWRVSNFVGKLRKWDDWFLVDSPKKSPPPFSQRITRKRGRRSDPVVVFVNPVGHPLSEENEKEFRRCVGAESVAIECLNPIQKELMSFEQFSVFDSELDAFFEYVQTTYDCRTVVVATTGPVQVAFLIGTKNILNLKVRKLILVDYLRRKYEVAFCF